MDMYIGEMTSTLRATDSLALLSPELLEQIVRAVLRRLREEQAHERQVADDRQLRSGVSGAERGGQL
jgi:hypothetical protein